MEEKMNPVSSVIETNTEEQMLEETMLAESLSGLLEAQKEWFRQGSTIPLSVRRQALQNLKGALKLHEKEVLDALHSDLGKSSTEGYMSEVGMVYEEIDFLLRHLEEFARAKPHLTPLREFAASSKTVPIPYGSVLILSPWNYPLMLCLIPLADALAAGNTAIIKPGHASEHTSAVIEKIISETFDPLYVKCILGGRDVIQALLALDFDYFFFTGGEHLGRMVMQAAASHMRPVTLELGGKSPAVVDRDANLPMAARRIVFGKLLNAGQTCVAVDYVLVHEDVKEDFINLLIREFARQMPNPADMPHMISKAQYDKVISLVDPDKVIYGGLASEPTLQISPTIMDNVTWEDPVMQQEIFGPILPVLTFQDFHAEMKDLAARPTPLAFYLFTRNKLHQNYMQYVQPFGGGCINDTVIQLDTSRMPFGGMGRSGMGQYHGKYGFETFSHTKAIVNKANWPDLPMRYNDRKSWMEKIIRLVIR